MKVHLNIKWLNKYKMNIYLQISSDHPQHILLETHHSRRIQAAQ